MKTPLNKDSQAYMPKKKIYEQKSEDLESKYTKPKIGTTDIKLNINAKPFKPKIDINIGATYIYNGINRDYDISKKSDIKKIVVTAFTENGDAICHLISSQKNENYENAYVEVKLGETYKKTYYVSTNNCLIVDKEQFHNNNENITLQSDVISTEKINEINNKSKDNYNFYTINNKSQNNYDFYTLPENYGQQFPNYPIFNSNNYNINDGYGNMFINK